MVLKRCLQREILQRLATQYPEEVAFRDLASDVKNNNGGNLEANLFYLHEHGLIKPGHHFENLISTSAFTGRTNNPLAITARGLDFLEQDGGLSAILGTVTVKLHADTIKDMLESRILSAELPPEEKKRFVDTLRELPGEALKTFTNKLVEMACDNPQAVVTALSRLVP